MSQNILTIEYSDDLLHRLSVTRERFSDEAKFLLAAKLYELVACLRAKRHSLPAEAASNFFSRSRISDYR